MSKIQQPEGPPLMVAFYLSMNLNRPEGRDPRGPGAAVVGR